MNEEFLLSVVIPTKNRSNYCIKVIEQILSSTTDKTEIIIQDNNSDLEMVEYIEALKHTRVFINHQEKTLSFVDNFSEAVSFAKGKYVCMIGDDDGVLPNIEMVAEYALNHNYEAVVPGLNSVYIWPTSNPIVKHGENGYLAIMYLKNTVKDISVESELLKLIDRGFQEYQKTNVPRLYHGLISKRILDDLYAQQGTYFGGLTPDMYMSVALSLKVKKALAIGFPITVSGICPSSGSAASATGAHTGQLKDAPHFIGHDDYHWDSRVPSFYSVETIWADTGIHALDDFKKENIITEKCLLNLYARLWNKYPQFVADITKAAEDNQLSVAQIKRMAKNLLFRTMKNKYAERIFRKPGSVIKKYNLQDIRDAAVETFSVMQIKGISEQL